MTANKSYVKPVVATAGIGNAHAAPQPSPEFSWEECTDESGKRYLFCRRTQERFSTYADEADAAGWTRYHDPAIGGNGHWWWHNATGRHFADPGRHNAFHLESAAVHPAAQANPDVANADKTNGIEKPDEATEAKRDLGSECQDDGNKNHQLATVKRNGNKAAQSRDRGAASEKQACSFVSPEDIDMWICLDFEWTCDEGENRRVHCDEGEIIEFSFVVWDSRDNSVKEVQNYCKPERTPVTDFCTELTGISEETLANAGSLGDALDSFEDTLEKLNVSSSRCYAVTHGPCDLELTLPRNCAAIGREVPSALRQYVDLRELAQQYVRKLGINKRASSLREICDLTGVEMVGDEHCGLDDAWMVLTTLQVLLNTKIDVQVVNIDIEREIFLNPGCVHQALVLDGVPWGATEEQIQLWLEGLIAPMPAGSRIVIMLGADGRPCGRAVVDFASHEAAQAAFEILACSVWSPGGRVYAFTDAWCGFSERLVLVRPLRRQEGVLNLGNAG